MSQKRNEVLQQENSKYQQSLANMRREMKQVSYQSNQGIYVVDEQNE